MIFYHVLSEAILYQGKHFDLNNTLINCQYLENCICQVLVTEYSLHSREEQCGGHFKEDCKWSPCHKPKWKPYRQSHKWNTPRCHNSKQGTELSNKRQCSSACVLIVLIAYSFGRKSIGIVIVDF